MYVVKSRVPQVGYRVWYLYPFAAASAASLHSRVNICTGLIPLLLLHKVQNRVSLAPDIGLCAGPIGITTVFPTENKV